MSRCNEVKADYVFYVYILQSLKDTNRFYIGSTNDLKRRFKEHNDGNSIHTNKYVPWKIKQYFAFDNQATAESFEKYLKSGNGRIFIKKRLQ